MVKKVTEQYECDKCGKVGERYAVTFPDATLMLDRCALHAKKLEGLRNEVGEWVSNLPARQVFKKTSLAELRSVVKKDD